METHSSSSNSVCGDFLRSVEESSFIDEINASNEYFKNSQTLLIPIIPILYNFHSFGPAVNVSKRSRRIRRKKIIYPQRLSLILSLILKTYIIHLSTEKFKRKMINAHHILWAQNRKDPRLNALALHNGLESMVHGGGWLMVAGYDIVSTSYLVTPSIYCLSLLLSHTRDPVPLSYFISIGIVVTFC